MKKIRTKLDVIDLQNVFPVGVFATAGGRSVLVGAPRSQKPDPDQGSHAVFSLDGAKAERLATFPESVGPAGDAAFAGDGGSHRARREESRAGAHHDVAHARLQCSPRSKTVPRRAVGGERGRVAVVHAARRTSAGVFQSRA